MNEITKMVLVTTLICSFCAALLGALNDGLKKRIDRQKDYFIRGPAVKELFGGCPNDPLSDQLILVQEKGNFSIYPWIEGGKVRRVILEWPGRGGYGGDVTVMTAVDLESDRVYGVRVTQHKETPGVGTRAMEPLYLNKYIRLLAKEDIRLKKDGGQVDAVSGASRSSAAIADGVDQATKFVMANKNKIVESILAKRPPKKGK
jgi:electron transport complex protein RnfG